LCFSKSIVPVRTALTPERASNLLINVPSFEGFGSQLKQPHAAFWIQIGAVEVSQFIQETLPCVYTRSSNAAMLSGDQGWQQIVRRPGQNQKRKLVSPFILCRVDVQCDSMSFGDIEARKLYATDASQHQVSGTYCQQWLLYKHNVLMFATRSVLSGSPKLWAKLTKCQSRSQHRGLFLLKQKVSTTYQLTTSRRAGRHPRCTA
jgi:hypothetical protein